MMRRLGKQILPRYAPRVLACSRCAIHNSNVTGLHRNDVVNTSLTSDTSVQRCFASSKSKKKKDADSKGKEKCTKASSKETKATEDNVKALDPPPQVDKTYIIEELVGSESGYDDSGFKLTVDHAPSARSCCAMCNGMIKEGGLRIGCNAKATTGDFTIVRWFHPECIPFQLRRYPSVEFTCPQQVSGIASLNDENYRAVLRALELPEKPMPDKLLEASTRISKISEVLKQMSINELKEAAESNGAKFQSGKSATARLVAIISDALAFGSIPPCPECGGILYYRQTKYKCSGYVDALTRCMYKTREVKRRRFVFPPSVLKAYNKACKKSNFTDAPDGSAVSERPLMDPIPGEDEEEDLDTDDVAQPPALPPDVSRCFEGVRIVILNPSHPSVPRLKQVLEAGGCRRSDIYEAPTPTPQDFGMLGTDMAVGVQGDDVLQAKNAPVLHPAFFEACLAVGYRISLICLRDQCFIDNKPYFSNTQLANRNKAMERKGQEDAAAAQATAISSTAGTTGAPPVAEEKRHSKRLVVKGGIPVDPDCPHANTSHVYYDGCTHYSVTLSRTDITTGKNSFYNMQVLENDDRSGAYLFRKWGRVGDLRHMDFTTKSYRRVHQALREFEKVFFERTGNLWSDRNSFEPKPSKYALLDMKLIDESTSKVDGNDEHCNVGSSVLEEPTRYLVSKLFDTTKIEQAMLEMELDVKKMPLGNIDDKTIKRGYQALQQLQELLDKVPQNPQNPKKLLFTPEQKRRVQTLTNQFYTYIPHALSMKEALRAAIDTKDKLAQKTLLVQDLEQIGITTKLLNSSTNTVDAHYRKLKADLTIIPPTDERYKLVEQYMKETHGKTHYIQGKIKYLWELKRHGEDARYDPWKHYSNRMLLWHGSRFTNWVGILSQGLRIAPPEAPSTGYMFGKGIYFADMFTKSANYCHISSGSEGLMTLAEVALGNQAIRYRSDYITSLPSGEDSVFARGRNTPTKFTTTSEGIVVPIGDIQTPKDFSSQDYSLMYNEYIIYKEDQCRMRYLVMVDFS